MRLRREIYISSTYRINRKFAAIGESPIWLTMPLLVHLAPLWDVEAWFAWLFTNRQTFEKKFI